MDDFETSVIKTNEELKPEDIKVILENKEKWNDEEKVRFEKLTETGFPVEEAPPVDDGGGEKKDEKPPIKTEAADVPDAAAQLEIQALKTKKEIDDYIASKKKELEDAGKSKVEIKEEKDKIIEFWKYAKNEKNELFIPEEKNPRDWNHAFTYFLNFLNAHPEILLDKIAPSIRERITAMDVEDRKKNDDLNKGYDTELGGLFKENKIPDPKTTDGKLVDFQMTTLAVKYGLTSMKDAYDLWAKIPVDQGGGYGWKPGVSLKPKEDVGGASGAGPIPPKITPKQAAAKVGGGGGGTKQANPRPYSALHKKSMDELIPG